MPQPPYRLPPFDALVAFESVARLGSMSDAATELFVTQSAISHRMRRLESFMGLPLLLRRNPGIVPTPAGMALLDALRPLLDSARELRSRCHFAATPKVLRVGLGAALAEHWLVQRLPAFAALHPEIAVELVVMENEAPPRATEVDVRVLWVSASQAAASHTQRPLFREHVFPVCAPSLMRPVRTLGGAAALEHLPLVHKVTPGHQAGTEWAWETWFSRLHLHRQPRETLRVNSIGPAIGAALKGTGVALARTLLVADALATRRLVRVLPPEMDLLSTKLHVARWPARLAGDARVQTFVAWLHARAQDSLPQAGAASH